MRATQTTTYRSLQSFLDRTSDRMQTLQLQAATGKRINRPSDDPTAISPMLSARTQIMSSNRYLETIDSGMDRINNMDGYLDSMQNTLVRLKEIGVATINSSLSPQDMQTYADEVHQLRETLISDGNAQVDGKYLFAGFSEKTSPFAVNTSYDPALYNPADPATYPVTYQGDNGNLQFEIAPNELINLNITGSSLFLGDNNNDGVTDPGAVDIFALLTTMEDVLRANNQATGWTVPGATAVTTVPFDPAGTPEVQTQDLSGIAGSVGDTVTWMFADGSTASYVLATAITADTDMDAALNGVTLTDSLGRNWLLAANAGDGSLSLTQTSGNSPAGAITSTQVTNDSGLGTAADPADGTGIVATPGQLVTAEVQTLDLSTTTLTAGQSLILNIDGTDFTYTNTSGVYLTGVDLTAAIAADLAVANYTLSDAGAGVLNIAQNVGSESDIAPVITTVETPATTLQALLEPIENAANQVRGQRSLKGNIGKRLETARDHMEQIKIDMEAFRSRFEDADILETITSLQQQQQSFEAALSVTGKVSQLSILDYI